MASLQYIIFCHYSNYLTYNDIKKILSAFNLDIESILF